MILGLCNTLTFALCRNSVVPNRGIASETWGRVSATRFRNTVSDSKMVTPETVVAHLCSMIRSRSSRPFADGVDERLLLEEDTIVDQRPPVPFSLSIASAIVDEEKSAGAEARRANSFHRWERGFISANAIRAQWKSRAGEEERKKGGYFRSVAVDCKPGEVSQLRLASVELSTEISREQYLLAVLSAMFSR